MTRLGTTVDQVNEIAESSSRPRRSDPGGNINATRLRRCRREITHHGEHDDSAGGNAHGAGIMIVDGDLTIDGNFEFKGLIIVRGRTRVTADPATSIFGDATIYGSLWTNDLHLDVGGSAIVNYSSQALALANVVNGGEALPAPIKVVALADCSQAPAAPGC
jgi:hypothetical protein